MNPNDIYKLGKWLSVGFSLEKDDERLNFIRYPYNSKEIISAVALSLSAVIITSLLTYLINSTFGFTLLFIGLIICAIMYIYPTHILYSQMMVEYNEQMLKAVLSLSNYIAMRTSFEYAWIKTTEQLKGILKREFMEIGNMIQRKGALSLGDAIDPYIQKWVDINPVFIKSLRLLQTALMAAENDRQTILQETIRTLMINFRIQGKRSTEELASNARNLVFFGVLFPVTSLMLLPLFSTFLTDLITAGTLFFMFNILFPVVILLVALNFANKRVQVDTIDLKESINYRALPRWAYIVAFGIVLLLAIPGLVHLNFMDTSTPEQVEIEYQFWSIFKVWLISAGIMAGIYLLAWYYVRMHQKLWKDVKEIEDDLPHLLQNLSTLLSINMPIENILPRIANEYKEEGFSKHPVVRVFSEVSRKLISSKERLETFMKDTLKDICPSTKMANILNMIISFSRVSQDSATNATKLMREQTLSLLELDDYIKTLLSETISLLNITITMLMPLLSAVAVIMSIMIVKSLRFIMEELQDILGGIGVEQESLALVDITKVLPPTVVEMIVSIYFIEMFVVLCLFKTKVNYGNDGFQFARALKSNILGFLIYSGILIGGYFIMMEIFFKSMLELA